MGVAGLMVAQMRASGQNPGPTQAGAVRAPAVRRALQPIDVFALQRAGDPQIAPDGRRIVFERHFMDEMKDRERTNLWIVASDGSDLRPLTTGIRNDGSPRWSPDGNRLAYVSNREEGAQIWIRWMDSGQEAKATSLRHGPGELKWSPDGRSLAFTMFVAEDEPTLATMPPKPDGAEWAPPARVITHAVYRADDDGYLESGHTQVFIVPAEGGEPRQLTFGPYDHGSIAWTPDGKAILVSAIRRPESELEQLDTEIYEVALADGAMKALTKRKGPDNEAAPSPDGKLIAFTGFDDRYQGYQVTHLYVMDRDGSNPRMLAAALDRDVAQPTWSADGKGLFVQSDDHGDTKILFVPISGAPRVVAEHLGGADLGRPYAGGSFSVARDGTVAYMEVEPDHPGDVAVVGPSATRRLTRLNDALLAQRTLGRVEEIRYKSSADGREIQGWIIQPPNFEASKKYPLILEIHGGPYDNYGTRFAMEHQLYAAAGNVVLYINPRGSTSYGEEFGNLIHKDYPNHDYYDLMSGVDAVIAKGYVDTSRLYVTGGSGGGVLTAWIVGHTDRFRAAVSQKPVINWTSWALTTDNPPFGAKYWFGAMPWDAPELYRKLSPLTYAGNVKTPTMLLTGEVDYRTPIAESEQFYEALRLRNVPSALVRIPEASHNQTARPSNMIKRAVYVLAWFNRYGGSGGTTP
jgi:acylaminoacyl-peptidase